ncbi:MAG: tetratricopeptide repeat protein, partial [Candidatus Binatia bacterium]
AYEQATEIDPGSIAAWRGLGWSFWQLGDRDRAFEVWREIAKVRPNEPDILIALAQAHEYREEWESSLGFYSRVLEQRPDSLPALMGRARINQELQRYPAAERDLRRVLARHPGEFDAKFMLAQIYKTSGRRDEALALFDELARRGAEPRHLRSLADVMLEVGRAEEAIRYYERNLQVNPGNRGTILGLARAHAQLHRYPKAIAQLEAYMVRHPDDAKMREELARFAAYGGDYRKAEQHLRTLVQRHPDEVKWQMSLAQTLQDSGQVDEPVEIAKQILAKDPKNTEALQLLLENALFGGRRMEAVQWLERLVAAKPTVRRMNQLGDIYVELGDDFALEEETQKASDAYARSAQIFRRAMALDPRNADALLGVATALRLRGDYAEAIEAAQQVLVRYPNVERARRELYESHLGLEQYDVAEELMRSTLDVFPGNLRLRHELARARFKKGDRAGAIAQVKHYLAEPIRESVPVLLYHGVSESSTREDTMPLRNFRDQMEALRREGYQSITIHQLLDFYEKGTPLPPKAIYITFDDARADSYRYADPVLRDTGFQAAMYVPVAE